MTEWFYHVTCFAKVSLLLMNTGNIKANIFIMAYRKSETQDSGLGTRDPCMDPGPGTHR